MEIIFYICGIVSILTTIRIITHTNPIHALIYFVVFLFSISGIFFSIGSYFAGALEIIIYAGAIIVLFIFVIMMLNIGKKIENQENKQIKNSILWILPVLVFLIFTSMLIYAILQIKNVNIISSKIIEAKEVGIQLFSKYIVVVELASILLLAGLIVSLHIGRKDKK